MNFIEGSARVGESGLQRNKTTSPFCQFHAIDNNRSVPGSLKMKNEILGIVFDVGSINTLYTILIYNTYYENTQETPLWNEEIVWKRRESRRNNMKGSDDGGILMVFSLSVTICITRTVDCYHYCLFSIRCISIAFPMASSGESSLPFHGIELYFVLSE